MDQRSLRYWRLGLLAALGTATAMTAQVLQADPHLPGTSWSLIELAGRDIDPVSTYGNLIFRPDGSGSANAGCNYAEFRYGERNQTLEIKIEAVSEAGCLPEPETSFFAALDETQSFVLEGPVLALVDGEGDVRVRFQRPDLAGSAWEQGGRHPNFNLSRLVADVLLTFDQTGGIQFETACSRQAGHYAQNGSQLEIAWDSDDIPHGTEDIPPVIGQAADITYFEMYRSRLAVLDETGALIAHFNRTPDEIETIVEPCQTR